MMPFILFKFIFIKFILELVGLIQKWEEIEMSQLNNIDIIEVEKDRENKKIINDIKISAVVNSVSELLNKSKYQIKMLDLHLEKLNQGKDADWEVTATFADVLTNTLGDKLNQNDSFDSEDFVEKLVNTSLSRIEQKLKILNKFELVLGLEFLVDSMIKDHELTKEDEELNTIFRQAEGLERYLKG